MKLFRKLEAARILRGHTVYQAIHEIGIALPTWYSWRQGRVGEPRVLQRRAVEEYIGKAGK